MRLAALAMLLAGCAVDAPTSTPPAAEPDASAELAGPPCGADDPPCEADDPAPSRQPNFATWTLDLEVARAPLWLTGRERPLWAMVEVTWWDEVDVPAVLCRQTLSVTGVASPHPWTPLDPCRHCRWELALDPRTVVDVSDPAHSPDGCDPKEIADPAFDVGRDMLTPWPDGLGEFLEMGLVTAPTMEQVDERFADGTGWPAAGDLGWDEV